MYFLYQIFSIALHTSQCIEEDVSSEICCIVRQKATILSRTVRPYNSRIGSPSSQVSRELLNMKKSVIPFILKIHNV